MPCDPAPVPAAMGHPAGMWREMRWEERGPPRLHSALSWLHHSCFLSICEAAPTQGWQQVPPTARREVLQGGLRPQQGLVGRSAMVLKGWRQTGTNAMNWFFPAWHNSLC